MLHTPTAHMAGAASGGDGAGAGTVGTLSNTRAGPLVKGRYELRDS
jgi:hypothetical protein